MQPESLSALMQELALLQNQYRIAILNDKPFEVTYPILQAIKKKKKEIESKANRFSPGAADHAHS